ncbi:MAG: glycerate kinase [Candidatus Thorarchaeota archaeon]
MYIKNISQLIPTGLGEKHLELRKIGLEALELAIESVKPDLLIKQYVSLDNSHLIINNDKFNLSDFDTIYFIGGGKASAQMALSLIKIFKKSSITNYKGLINIPENLEIENLKANNKVTFNYASHPIPNENGLNGTKTMFKLIEKTTKKDLIICFISGGGSALLPFPKQNISLKDLQDVNSLLLASGASIHEINTIRKHISELKGGNLARKVYNSSGATLISLIISDVVGNNLDSIASGPTVPDATTYRDATEILKKYNIIEKLPSTVKEIIENGQKDPRLETPKKGDKCFNNVYNYLIGSVDSAAEAIINFLNNHNFKTKYFSNKIIGEAKEFGKSLFEKVSNEIKFKMNISRFALIGSGELTVTIEGNGIGGRNQEMLLSFLDRLIYTPLDRNYLLIGANLDGIEGNSKAMGALIDNSLVERVLNQNIELKNYLNNNDSNSFFKKVKTEIITGPTGCNVNDILLILITS